jgi:hypothetical protein
MVNLYGKIIFGDFLEYTYLKTWRTKMNSITKKIIFYVVCTVLARSLSQFASACEVNEFYLTKDGTLAASTSEVLLAAIKFQDEGNKVTLADLIQNGTVLRLTDNIKVQVLERSFEFKTLKIKLPEGKELYWVKDGSLKQIN